LTVSYNASSGAFSVTGPTTDFFDPSNNDDPVLDVADFADSYFVNGEFTLSATINNSGVYLPGSGSVTFSAAAGVADPTESYLIYGPGTLLQGNITAFGSQGGSEEIGYSEFDFEFAVTNGELASFFGPEAGTLLVTGDDSFNGSFESSFTSTFGAGNQDTWMMVPEPEPFFLVILSMLGLCWVARWRASLRKG
jgi:hypothetical protein